MENEWDIEVLSKKDKTANSFVWQKSQLFELWMNATHVLVIEA